MNCVERPRSLLIFYVVVFSWYITKVAGSGCLSGWVLNGNMCYRIINEMVTDKQSKGSCRKYNSTLAQNILGLDNIIGYEEEVWVDIMNSASSDRFKISPSGNKITSGSSMLRPLCEKNSINSKPELSPLLPTFSEGHWIIPNTMKTIYSLNNYHGDFWIGLYAQNGVYYWGDGTIVTKNELSILPNHTFVGNRTRCAYFHLQIIQFVHCGCRFNALKQKPYNNYRFTTFDPVPCNKDFMTKPMPKTTGSSSSVTITQSMTRTTDTSLTSFNAITDSSSVMITQPTTHTTDERLTSNNTTTVLDTTMSILTTPETACCCWGSEKPAETKEELSKMFIPRTETSRYKRSKTSAPDERKSSKVIASVAIVAMAVPLVLIVTADLISFLQSPFIKNLKCLASKTQTHLEVTNDVNKI